MKSTVSALCIASLISLAPFAGADVPTWTTIQGWNGTYTGGGDYFLEGSANIYMGDNLMGESGTVLSIEGNTHASPGETTALTNGRLGNNSNYRNSAESYNLTAGTVATIQFAEQKDVYGVQLYSYHNRTTLGVAKIEVSLDGTEWSDTGAEPIAIAPIANATANCAVLNGCIGTIDTRETPFAKGIQALRITFANPGTYVELMVQGTKAKVDSYAVNFWNKDGTESLLSLAVQPGETVTPPNPPELPGYWFSHWAIEPDGADAIDENLLADVQSNLELYAVYYPDGFTYKVSFLNRDGTVCQTFAVTPRSSVAEEDVPVLSDEEWFKFAGWSGEGWKRVTSDRIIEPVFTPYWKVELVNRLGSKVAELKVLNGNGVEIPGGLDVEETLPDGSVLTGWEPDYSCVTSNMILRPVYAAPDSLLWESEVIGNSTHSAVDSHVIFEKYADKNLLLIEGAEWSICRRDNTNAVVASTLFDNEVYSGSTYCTVLPSVGVECQFVFPETESSSAYSINEIVFWTIDNAGPSYERNNFSCESIEYKRKPDGPWLPVSPNAREDEQFTIEALPSGTMSAAYGYRIVVRRRNYLPLVRSACALRILTGATPKEVRCTEIQVNGGKPATGIILQLF